MKKGKITKFITLAMVLSMAFSMTAFAAGTSTETTEKVARRTQSYTSSFSGPFSQSYVDNYGVWHLLSGSASCTATISWDEGIAGWISSAHFPTPNATIDNALARLTIFSTTKGIGSSYSYQEFKINDRDKYIRSSISCDAYGDASFYASCR